MFSIAGTMRLLQLPVILLLFIVSSDILNNNNNKSDSNQRCGVALAFHQISIYSILLDKYNKNMWYSSAQQQRLKFQSALDSSYNNNNNDLRDDDDPKIQLLTQLQTTRNSSNGVCTVQFGFNDSTEAKQRIQKLVNDLSGYVLPLQSKNSQWQLLYTNAPDILGFQGGPLSQLLSIRQNVHGGIGQSNQLEIILEYQPSNQMIQFANNLLSQNIQQDRLTQSLIFDYQIGSMNKVELQLQGTQINATRLPGSSPPKLQIPTGLPLGGFSIIFNDDDIRIDQSFQGDFLFILQRID